MNRRAFALSLAFAAAPLTRVLAHEGHDHKLLGTLTEVAADRIVVKAVKGDALSTVAIAATTKITRAKKAIAAGDLKVGDRVVVNIGNGKAPLTAKAIEVGPAPATR